MKNKVLVASLLALFTNLGAFSFVERQNVQPTSNIQPRVAKAAGEMQQLITPQQIAEEIEMAEILAPAVEAGVEAAEAEESAEEKIAEKQGWGSWFKSKGTNALETTKSFAKSTKAKVWDERSKKARMAIIVSAIIFANSLRTGMQQVNKELNELNNPMRRKKSSKDILFDVHLAAMEGVLQAITYPILKAVELFE